MSNSRIGAEIGGMIKEIFKPNPARKAVAEIIDLSPRMVLDKLNPDKDGYKPSVTEPVLIINDLPPEAGLTLEAKIKYVEQDVNKKRKQYGMPKYPVDLSKDKPWKTEKIEGGEKDTWTTGLGGTYSQKKAGADNRNTMVKVNIERQRIADGATTYFLRRLIEKTY